MKIVVDENIPFGQRFFERFGDVVTAPGRHLTAAQVRDADALIIRSVTRVDEQLLAGSRVKFVGTCTIGIDHLDTTYLRQNHVTYASAPGCNAGGVVQYDLAALTQLDRQWREKRLGVIGCGNVGSRLCKTLNALGVDYVVYDPFLQAADNPHLSTLEQVLDCEIVCMHTPYTTAGPHPTHHMINAENLGRLRSGAILLNAGRGGAIDNEALLAHLQGGADLRVVLDVWEHEPEVDLALMERVVIGSPHIAGYSFEGKIQGSAMIFAALVKHLDLDEAVFSEQLHRVMSKLKGQPETIHCTNFAEAIAATYDISADHGRFCRALTEAAPAGIGPAFDLLRKTYPERREFSHFSVVAEDLELKHTLNNIGFLSDDE